MTLPAAYAPISLGQIQGEFGGDAPIYLSEYYRGGAYTTNNNTNVPTSGTIALSNFYSAWRGILVSMGYSRDAGLTNYFDLSAVGFPTVTLTAPSNGTFNISSYIAPNVTYTITGRSDGGTASIIQGYDFITDLNQMWLEDGVDGDYNDLRWIPSQGEIFDNGGGNFTYILYY
jgi:hypothetical protein